MIKQWTRFWLTNYWWLVNEYHALVMSYLGIVWLSMDICLWLISKHFPCDFYVSLQFATLKIIHLVFMVYFTFLLLWFLRFHLVEFCDQGVFNSQVWNALCLPCFCWQFVSFWWSQLRGRLMKLTHFSATGCWSAGNHANQIGPSVTIPESAVAVQLQSVHSTARKNSVTFINLGFHSQLESAL